MMKYKYTLSLLFLIFSQYVFAQVTEVFPSDDARWELAFTCYDDFDPYPYNATIELTGDTIIDNKSYIIVSGLGQFYVRVEDSKIFVRGNSFSPSQEQLVYDFNLEVGDVFHYQPSPNPPFGDSTTIVGVEYVEYLDGVSRKTMQLDPPFNNICGTAEYWVEEITSIMLPFYFIECFECQLDGFKFFKDDVLVFDNIISSIAYIDHEPSLQVFPNPVKNNFKISSDQQIHSIRLTDLMGNEVLNLKINNRATTVQLPVSIQPGLYLLETKLDQDKRIVQKIIVTGL